MHSPVEALVEELARMHGILPEYWDIFGTRHITTTDTKKSVLEAMHVKTGTEQEIAEEIAAARARMQQRVLPPVAVCSVNKQPLVISAHFPATAGVLHSQLLRGELTDENGLTAEVALRPGPLPVHEELELEGRSIVRTEIALDHVLEKGYYTFRLTASGDAASFSAEMRLIVTPDSCYLPREAGRERSWGLSVNLYALRSQRNWGVGDLGDLPLLLDAVKGFCCGCIGLSPLHCIPNSRPYGLSPYSPISRLYRNMLYISVDHVDEVHELPSDPEREIAVRGLREKPFVDYEGVAAIKDSVLRDAFAIFYHEHYDADTGRSRDFRAYLEQEGEPLQLFATFMALRERFLRESKYSWQEWPEDFRNPDSDAVVAFRRTNEKDVLYWAYLQWILDRQLGAAASAARDADMSLGIYQDLAVGAIGGGSDVWQYRECFGRADVGAPPDDFNINGQNWGFPPMIPSVVQDLGYEPFIQTIRKNMRHAGALRIDHALGLFRLYWIPEGVSPQYGAYVRQPAEDFLRIIALESERNKTVVIAEDLGTIDESFRNMLQEFGMLSYRLFYFERNYPDPSFKKPQDYPAMALCSVTTHDLPTLTGYWAGRDITVKEDLRLYPSGEQVIQDRASRARDKKLILDALAEQGLFDAEGAEDADMSPELCAAIYAYLSRTPCRIVLASLDDLLGAVEQANMPGTVDQHPNWVRKLPVLIEDLDGSPAFQKTVAMLSRTVS